MEGLASVSSWAAKEDVVDDSLCFVLFLLMFLFFNEVCQRKEAGV